jgi:hypothetical protein
MQKFVLGNRFDTAKISTLMPGVSTDADAVQQLGPPSATSTNVDGSQALQWLYSYGTAVGTTGSAHAVILFGPDGKMIRLAHLSQQQPGDLVGN